MTVAGRLTAIDPNFTTHYSAGDQPATNCGSDHAAVARAATNTCIGSERELDHADGDADSSPTIDEHDR